MLVRRADSLRFDLPTVVACEIEEADEGFGLGDAEVVAREEAEPAGSGQEVPEVGIYSLEAPPARSSGWDSMRTGP